MQKYNCDSQKLQPLRQALNRMHLLDKRQVEEAATGLLPRGEDNLSRHYRKTNRVIKAASLQPLPITPEGKTESSTQQRSHITTPTA